MGELAERTVNMNASTFVILLVILVLAAFSARRLIRSFSGKGGCHGGGSSAPSAKRVKVSDTDESHYPYAEDIKISGMTCDRCRAAVESALNAVDGTWARVDLPSGTAHVLSKQPIDRAALDRAIVEAGYYVSTAQ